MFGVATSGRSINLIPQRGRLMHWAVSSLPALRSVMPHGCEAASALEQLCPRLGVQ
jgi:hypothetical protein